MLASVKMIFFACCDHDFLFDYSNQTYVISDFFAAADETKLPVAREKKPLVPRVTKRQRA